MGNYRTTYMELDDFRVSCIQGYPYEGFVIGCGYAYVENIPSEMAILENSSYIYNPIKVQQIDTSLLAIIKSLHLTPDDIRNKLVSEKGDMYVLNIPEGPLMIPKKDSEIIISTDESDTYFNIKIEVKSKDINETYNYEYNHYYIDRWSIELLKLLGTKDTNTLIDSFIDYSKEVCGYVGNFAEGLTKTGKTRISNKNLRLY
ncbi:MAG TPA: tail tape measure protein, partial [Bacteroides uniformis]|nr:tail tape measure protein [Bacteroides uniformis]